MAERSLPRLVIFDLDGTLVDTVPDIAVALNAALVDLAFPEVSATETRRWVGDGARVLCGRAIARGDHEMADPLQADALLERFLARYAERVCEASRVYDGVEEVLRWLRTQGCRLACVTNKPAEHTEILLQSLKLRASFDLVFGGDSLPARKPDPLPLLECLRHFGVAAHEALMIGDSDNDVTAARAAGIECACVTYGYSQGHDVHTLGAALVIVSLRELSRYFKTANAT
ncbi:MAG TPA: phosphoglycolate phosphatase [Gammaproteobacteria bacterium]